jgi:hypothetical protein
MSATDIMPRTKLKMSISLPAQVFFISSQAVTLHLCLALNISNELWRVHASVTTITFELAIDGFGDKRLGGVNVQ